MIIGVNSRTSIIFDLDDTLYNEIEFLKSGFRHIATQFSPNNPNELFFYMFSLYRNKKDVFDAISSQFNVTKVELIQLYREHFPKISLFNGVENLIEDIKMQQGKIGIITDGRRLTQMNKIRSLGLGDLMDYIVISEDLGSEKPEMRNYRKMEEELQTEVFYYIGDNLRKDFISPNKLGWHTIGLLDNGLNIHVDGHLYMDREHMPENFIASFGELEIIASPLA